MTCHAIVSEDAEASDENRALAKEIGEARDAIFAAIVAAVKPEKRGVHFIFDARQLTIVANALGRTIGKAVAALPDGDMLDFINIVDEAAGEEVARRRDEGARETWQ